MESANRILININGNDFTFTPGETILDIAVRNHIDIPTLCHLNRAKPAAVCGICVVQIAGKDDLIPACETAAAPGMTLMTESDVVVARRKAVLSKLIATGLATSGFSAHTETSKPLGSFLGGGDALANFLETGIPLIRKVWRLTHLFSLFPWETKRMKRAEVSGVSYLVT